jgi:arylsulfatase A-like enzyme
MMSRPLLTLFVLFSVFGGTLSLVAAEKTQPPNVLFLFADDQRADTIGALGNVLIQTPNLDKLVHAGVSFRRAYMQGGMNPATCVPSRAMLLSGQSLFRIDEKLLRDPSWPEAFAQAGYTTFVSGKWHNGEASIPKCFQNARSMFTGGMSNPLDAPLKQLEGGKMTKPVKANKHACEIFADEAIRFLAEPKRGPFLCYLPFDAPHDPHIVPEEFPIKYDPRTIALPPNFKSEHPFDNGEMTIRDEVLLPLPRTPEDIRGMLADYYRYISFLDSQIGRVLEALEKSPYAKNTIVVFSADSGVARGSHGLIGKQNLYEHSVRVPLIISGPGVPVDKTSDAMCYLFDVFPTLGSLCGVSAPTTSEGVSFNRALLNPGAPARKTVRFAYKNVQQAACDSEWKLIYYPKIQRTQFFNLKEDPAEVSDLSESPEQQVRIEQMRGLLTRDE